MDLHYVIGEQLIAKRRGAARRRFEGQNFVAPRNGRIDRSGRQTRKLSRPSPFRSIDLKSAISSAFSRARKASAAAIAQAPRQVPGISLKPSPKFIKAVALSISICGFALAALGLSASMVGRTIDTASFSLPADDSIQSALLDSVSMEKIETDEQAEPFSMPVSLSMTVYSMRKDETIDSIARRFGVRLDTLISVNGIRDVRRIPSGTKLKIPNIDGIVHTVKRGESLSGIAAASGSAVIDIIDANDLSTPTIQPGQALFIPGAKMASSDLKKALGKLVIWPVGGRVSSGFGYRPNPFTGVRQFHSGIDIVAPENSLAKASIDGKVAETGYSALFGNFVILSHADGYQTLYAHLNKISVSKGKTVSQGTAVGLVGSTGYSTGVHLHFGVYRYGKAIDPLKLLGSR